MDEIWTVLRDVSYPTTRKSLVEIAVSAGAREDLLHRVKTLPAERYADADALGRDLARSRAGSNPKLVGLRAEPCEICGFPRIPGKPHSCIEEKARFAETANTVADELQALEDGPDR